MQMNASQTWLVANWKMNGDAIRTAAYAEAISTSLAAQPPHLNVVFCPPAPSLTLARSMAGDRLRIGGQDCHAADKGAYTGYISAAMLADVGCSHVILGHSERRAEGERCEHIAAKAEAAMAAGLTPILCIGESRAEYEAGKTASVLDTQLVPIRALSRREFMIAYEPVWAIGSHHTPSMVEIGAAHQHIKSALGSASCVLYGGSVNPGNAKEILSVDGVDGALIGGASLEISSMQALMASAAMIRG